MADLVQMRKKIALLHRHPAHRIKETNAAFPYLVSLGATPITFKEFNRLGGFRKFWKSLFWIIYAPARVIGRGYDIIYCDDSYPFYAALVKMASPRSRVVLRMGDFHLMYHYRGWVYDVLHFFERLSWHVVDEIIAISEPMAIFIRERTNTPVTMVPDPVNVFDFQQSLVEDDGSVMFHGMLTKNKNIDVLIEAAKLLPHTPFIIIGDGPDRKRLEALAPKNVTFRGWVPYEKMNQELSRCSVGVALRSDNHGNEYVVTSPFLQYGAMGKPCLVTRRAVFGNYEWQFSTPAQLARKINILQTRPQEGQKLRQYVVQHHHAEKVALSIWSRLLSLF